MVIYQFQNIQNLNLPKLSQATVSHVVRENLVKVAVKEVNKYDS